MNHKNYFISLKDLYMLYLIDLITNMQVIMQKIFKLFILSFIVILNSSIFANEINITTLDKLKRAVVSIDARISKAAYISVGSWLGTGFVIDKVNGLIITNNHVLGPASIGSYIITFSNGEQIEAKPLYYDIWQDYAILKVEPSELPSEIEQINFSKELVKPSDEVYVVGNAEGQGFSYHLGHVSNTNEISGAMPQGSYIVNLNTMGGASGSPVVNSKNEAIGILYGGAKTYAIALKSSYIIPALESIKQGSVPVHKHIGIISNLYSLNKAVRHRNFPKDVMVDFLKKFPLANNKVIVVDRFIKGTEASTFLKVGDIIWEANNIPVGGDLAVLDKAMNESNELINLTVYRGSDKITVKVPVYDVNDNKITSMISFGGANFYQADDMISARTGVAIGSLVATNIDEGASFSDISTKWQSEYKSFYSLNLTSINNVNVKNLNDLVQAIPNAIDQKFITIEYNNFYPYHQSFGGDLISAQTNYIKDISLDSVDSSAKLLKLNSNSLEWKIQDIKNEQKVP